MKENEKVPVLEVEDASPGTITLVCDVMRPSLIEMMIAEYDDMLRDFDDDDEAKDHCIDVLEKLREVRDLLGYAK